MDDIPFDLIIGEPTQFKMRAKMNKRHHTVSPSEMEFLNPARYFGIYEYSYRTIFNDFNEAGTLSKLRDQCSALETTNHRNERWRIFKAIRIFEERSTKRGIEYQIWLIRSVLARGSGLSTTVQKSILPSL